MLRSPSGKASTRPPPSAVLGAVTRKKNEIIPLLSDDSVDNRKYVRTLFGEYLSKVEQFVKSCNEWRESSTTDQDRVDSWSENHNMDISTFRERIECYLTTSNLPLQQAVSLDDKESICSRSSKGSGMTGSCKSNVSSVRLKLAIRRAKLEADKKFLTQQEELDAKRRKDEFLRREEEGEYNLQKKRIDLARAEVQTKLLEESLNHIEGITHNHQDTATDGRQQVDQCTERSRYAVSGILRPVAAIENIPCSNYDIHPNTSIGDYVPEARSRIPNYDYLNNNNNLTTDVVTPCSDGLTRILEKQNEISVALLRAQERSLLPKREVEVFDGRDLTLFPSFIQNFTRIIEESCTSSQDRYYYLKQYTSAGPKQLISSCDQYDVNHGYIEAKRLLIREYGNEYRIAQAYLIKLDKWPIIRREDCDAMRNLSVFLLGISNYMNGMSSLNQLNSWKEIANLVKKLPYKSRDRWRTLTMHLQDTNRPITFNVFVEFVQKQSDLINQPLFGDIQDESADSKIHISKSNNPKRRSLATKIDASSPILGCSYCKLSNHTLNECKFFIQKPLMECQDFVKKHNLCFGCLQEGHTTRGCTGRLTCSKCERMHPTCLHDDSRIRSQVPTERWRRSNPSSNLNRRIPMRNFSDGPQECQQINMSASENSPRSMQIGCSTGASNSKRRVACPVIPVRLGIKGSHRTKLTYAALDSHSSDNFLKESLLRELGIKCRRENIFMTTMENRNNKTMIRVVNDVELSDLDGNTTITLPVVYAKEQWPFSRQDLPSAEDTANFVEFRNIPFRYITEKDVEVGILVGMIQPDVLKPLEIINGPRNGAYASRHSLGWTFNGPTHTNKSSIFCRHVKITDKDDIEEKLESMYAQDFVDSNLDETGMSPEDSEWEAKVNSSIKLLDDGHFEIGLPFKTEYSLQSSNKDQIYRIFNRNKKRLYSDESYRKDYVDFMQIMMDHSFMERVPNNEINGAMGKVWYIAHHGVYHKIKKKIRVVFNCSLKYMGRSLNSALLGGPNLTNSLLGILLRFRQGRVAFQGDVEKMYYQVKVPKAHADFMRFFWYEDNNLMKNTVEYRLTRHVFGSVSSPSVANFALRKTSTLDIGNFSEEARKSVNRDFYVDDFVRSVEDSTDAIRLLLEVKKLVAKGGFNLTGFDSNSRDVLSAIAPKDLAKNLRNLDLNKDDLPYERALGVTWNVEKDTFGFKVNLKEQPFTRRGILSTIFSIYDPLNISAPILTKAKYIFQETCRLKLQWDEALPVPLEDQWKTWVHGLALLHSYEIPRCYRPNGDIERIELHYFSDGSEIAYGTVAYLRFVTCKNRYHCVPVLAKTRMTPLNNTTLKTIPRIELNAARLSISVQQILHRELDLKIDAEYFWTDSTAVLCYINNESRRYQRFVCNRITVIRLHTTKDQWRYVPSEDNPSDLISRGVSVSQFLAADEWKNGPAFLYADESEWPSQQKIGPPKDSDPEVKKDVIVATTMVQGKTATEKLIESSSSWYATKYKTAWMLRLKRCLHKRVWYSYPMTTVELEAAENAIFMYVQSLEFSETIDLIKKGKALKRNNKLIKLSPVIDKYGMLRVGGRLDRAIASYAVKHPIILPKDSHIAILLISESHHRVGHLGREATLADLRRNYWIIGANCMARRIIRNCIKCRKYQGKVSQQIMADLPAERLESDIAPFTNTAVDLFGPFYIKKNRKQEKRYGVIFSCLSSRAIHLEVAHTLDTSSFICALRRFVARRGDVRILRSDNGTNFVGSNRELKESIDNWNKNAISEWSKQRGINWIFQPPASSHHGGVFEREIRTIRKVLTSLLMEQPISFSDEIFNTLLCEVESILNGRPLTEVSNDHDDLEALTPNHLLLLNSSVTFPPGLFSREDLYAKRRWRQVQYLANLFWSRWRKEYLALLQKRQKWEINMEPHKVGDLVLVMDNLLPRSQWNLGRISEVRRDTLDRVRSVKIRIAKCKHNLKSNFSTVEIERPIVKIILLRSVGDLNE